MHRPDLLWALRVAVPFTWAASKNHIYALQQTGHRELRAESGLFRLAVARRIKSALGDQVVVQNKVWVEIFVQKPNHKGDAINVIHAICDAVKDAVGVDDRWFSIRGVDWQIIKHNPQIFITVGQEEIEDVRACSSCGRLQSLEKFQNNRAAPRGKNRVCLECSRLQDAHRDQRRAAS